MGKLDRTTRQQLAKDVLGHEHRLAIAEVILAAGDDPRDIDEIVTSSLASRTTVFNDLGLLERIGAVMKQKGVRNLYQRLDHPYWELAQQLLALSVEPSETEPSPG